MSNYPSSEQLLDLFNWASPGMLVTDADGAVVLANKAATELLRDNAAAGSKLAGVLGIDDYDALLTAGKPVENQKAAFTNPDFASGYANVGFGEVNGKTYGFWALRPVTTHPTPSPAPGEGPSTAQTWINQVDQSSEPYTPVGEDAVKFIQAYYDHCPVAIHLIEEDGTVAHANWKDIAIVGASEQPDTYVGHHIRHIYADQHVVEDFLGRWGEDAPIIDFRADFLNKGERVPVVIFSTAKVENNKLKNTRCFVFPDSHPDRERDKVKALDLSF
ncbi:PAS domain-containing protein [Streptomyces sp. NPDC006967]|uniref:PAS domain-containing protein n=1 Tax=unclassified Streptomyces TaxID=2593676 RepID=UPI000CD54EE0|nr:PAS domain-containing protein [Streptomyces sp. SM1]